MKLLQKFHEPYEKISLRQIKRARLHARKRGPGSNVPKVFSHRVRLDTSKVNHFIDFANRPYFYQDVAFRTRTLTLNGGDKHCTKNWIYSHLLMSKYDANAVQMCGKHGKCRIYFTFT